MGDHEVKAKAIELKQKFNGYHVEIVGRWIWISGNIANIDRDEAKSAELRYSEPRGKYYWRDKTAKWSKTSNRHADFNTVRRMFGSEEIAI